MAVSETAILVDRSPPVVGSYGDGDNIDSGDIDYQSSTDELCVHATGVADPESGISQILWEAGVYYIIMGFTLWVVMAALFCSKV